MCATFLSFPQPIFRFSHILNEDCRVLCHAGGRQAAGDAATSLGCAVYRTGSGQPAGVYARAVLLLAVLP